MLNFVLPLSYPHNGPVSALCGAATLADSTGASKKTVDCSGLKVELPDHQTVLLASMPLDDQGWEPLDEGSIVALKDREVVELTNQAR